VVALHGGLPSAGLVCGLGPPMFKHRMSEGVGLI
jgi:hypothetical protein